MLNDDMMLAGAKAIMAFSDLTQEQAAMAMVWAHVAMIASADLKDGVTREQYCDHICQGIRLALDCMPDEMVDRLRKALRTGRYDA